MTITIDLPTMTAPDNVVFDPPFEETGSYPLYQYTVNSNTTINVTFTATNNHYFTQIPTISATDISGFSVDINNLQLNADSTIVTFSFYSGSTSNGDRVQSVTYGDFILAEIAPTPTPTPTVSNGLVTHYKVSNSTINQIAQVTIYEQTGSSIGVVDLSPYITSIRFYPFDIPGGNDLSIILGYYNTSITAPVVSETYHAIDLGSVTLASTNNNANDYNATIKIMLPYIGYRVLDSNIYAGQTVNLRYNVNLSTGMFTANLLINGNLIDAFTGKIGQDVPYKSNGLEILNGYVDTSIQDTYPLQASILTIYHDNMTSGNLISTYQQSQLSNLSDTGLSQFTDIQLVNTIPDIMQREIISLLQGGIFI